MMLLGMQWLFVPMNFIIIVRWINNHCLSIAANQQYITNVLKSVGLSFFDTQLYSEYSWQNLCHISYLQTQTNLLCSVWDMFPLCYSVMVLAYRFFKVCWKSVPTFLNPSCLDTIRSMLETCLDIVSLAFSNSLWGVLETCCHALFQCLHVQTHLEVSNPPIMSYSVPAIFSNIVHTF